MNLSPHVTPQAAAPQGTPTMTISPARILKAVALTSAALVVAFYLTLGAYKLYLSTQIGHANPVSETYTSSEGGVR